MNPKIVNFTPIKDAKNFLGYCSLEIHAHLNGQLIPLIVKAKVMRNSNNGHVFITMHQESYKKSDGTTGYANIVRIPEEKYADFNKATAKAWDQYMDDKLKNDVQPLEKSGGDVFYPHGMAKNTQAAAPSSYGTQVYKQQEEELPF
jgi:hypothetical protein